MKAYLSILALMFAVGVTMIVYASVRYDWYTVPREEVWELSNKLHDLPRD